MGRHRSTAKRGGAPLRTGLLGASAAVAMGAVAVASGLLPGGSTFVTGGDSAPGSEVRAEGRATLNTQGDNGARPTASASGTPTGPTAPQLPSTSPTGTPGKAPSAAPPERKTEQTAGKATESRRPSVPAPRSQEPRAGAPERAASSSPATRNPEPPRKQSASSSKETAMEAEVLELVNQERAKVGCSPLRFDSALARLAGNFSADMAARGFFDHTDPDGDSPWDRAKQSGVKNLAAENIARGQADAAAVMNAWMNSDGHRANILNCDYKTLGVGVHLGGGGPWWTQNFGY
ncbi:CAP domain-containing protein [Streptomyces qinzhouensis]|uniref:CAP domain-containing protein n=1 Tax=Streptomyces qinzhouensis TaxID=2599401 RepID=A0A5B8JD00_9ACTN|nr:CAP domain-containing protein [Streptomyces qinzhouensis]QDY79226.1 CAP domain-containing protein [Streptomyces qinzhouensis]